MNRRLIAPVLALCALACAQTAQAQQQQQACVSPEDLSDAVVYAMPIAFDAARTTCANRLARTGFMATRGEASIARFRAEQAKAWPGAFRLLKTFMDSPNEGAAEEPGADIGAMLAGMPDTAVRPFVDALVGQMIAEEIKPDSCAKIERALELISPLPTDNVGGLVALLVEVADVKTPAVCTAPQAAPRR